MSDLEIQLRHSNIANVALKRIRKYCGKKTKGMKKKKKNTKHFIF